VHPHPASVPAGRPAQHRVDGEGADGRGPRAGPAAAQGRHRDRHAGVDYWRIWFFVLEACGLAVQLVNAAQARNLPGRPKTDKLDAQWLARLTEMGLLRASFVPPKAIRDLRDYTRARTRLIQERTRCWQRLEKLLVCCVRNTERYFC
jgi:transposase